jgi:pSer/pThr/pTyr-binding forkhead associated (FHA) protein
MTVQCSKGHSNPDGSLFCDDCGERLDPATGGPAVAAPPAPAPAPAAPSPAAPAYSPPAATPFATIPGVVAPSAAAKLVVEADGKTFDLGGKSEILIGREDPVSNIYPDVDLTPHGGEDGGVSRLHAKIFLQNGQYMIEDENSTNFTFVNKQKLAPKTPTPINNGDEIRLGRVVLKFQAA